jgi:acetamidase/formamidase
MNPYIHIKWQDGTVPTVGVNGAQTDDVLQVVIDRLEYLQDRVPCAENRRTLGHLTQALTWQAKRTARRQAQGVEGTEAPHTSAPA